MFRVLPLVRQRALAYSHQNVQIVTAPTRWYSNRGRRSGFFSQVVENVRSEFSRNKEMKENLKKFREEAQKLEQTDALKAARQKFMNVEAEAQKSSNAIKTQLGAFKEKVGDVLDEASKSDIAKKVTEELSKTAKGVSESISDTSEKLGKSGAFQAISGTTQMIKNEMDSVNLDSRVYKPLKKLRKRVEVIKSNTERAIEANEEATGVELHKDSKFYESWENFKNNNAYVNKVLDWKVKYDESENPVVRATRALTDKVTDIFGGMFSNTSISESMTELVKLDPSFNQKQFLHDCSTDFIPNILEAYVQKDLEILKDWCFEAAFAHIKRWIDEDKERYSEPKVLDIENVEIVGGQVMDQGPVLFISFQTQEIKRDRKENNDEKVFRFQNTWVLCRDREELNPKAAWRLLEAHKFGHEQFV